jgi:hypothetical protein
MKNTFGQTKSAILNTFTDLYTKKETKKIKNLLAIINENRDFKETYVLYEDIENMNFEDETVAKYYVEELSKSLSGKRKNITETCNKLKNIVDISNQNTSEIYETLDVLMENDNILNLENKVKAKIKLVKLLTNNKNINESYDTMHTNNEKLLMSLFSSDFNSYYGRTLSEEDKTKLKNILSLSNQEIEEKTKNLSEEILSSISNILSEDTDNELKQKLNKVKLEVMYMKPSKYNYFKLLELKNGLD